MSTITEKQTPAQDRELQLATFYVGDLLLALPIEHVQEINRNLDVTKIPHAPPHVLGVINLRGEVCSVIDLRNVLSFETGEVKTHSRNLIVRAGEESIGFWVDQISDIITLDTSEIAPPPSNLSGADGRFFKGVYQSQTEIVVVLNLEMVLDYEQSARSPVNAGNDV
jgi:purine-binding chemotaxis protein CheW